MGLFTVNDWGPGNGQRETGSARFNELIRRDFGRFFLANLFTVAGFLPFASGCVYAILSKSILVLIISALAGGAIAGPFLSGMADCIFRSLRDAPGGFFQNWKKAMRQNLKSSVLPGMILCLFTGIYLFMGVMIFYWASRLPGCGTIAIYFFGMLIMVMFFSVFWPQTVLLSLPLSRQIRNTLLFIAKYLWRVIGVSLLLMAYAAVMLLLLPWTLLVVPFAGFWFILLAVNFILYKNFNEAFEIEKKIAEQFPEQAPFNETDEEWLKRKAEESKKAPLE